MQFEQIELGKTGILTSPMGLGTWQWGDQLFWEYGKSHQESDLQAAFQASLAAGITFFDTAEVYGSGRSEKLLGAYLHALPEGAAGKLVATKFMPLPWRLTKGQLLNALRASLKRLGLSQVDLYQIHWPFPPLPVETWADALADAVQAGLTRSVGVSNYSPEQMRRAHHALRLRGVALASNQVEYSLLDRSAERNGLLALCQELGVTLIAYSPLAKGMLSGKYTPANLPGGMRSRIYSATYLEKIQPLIRLMRSIGQDHNGKNPAQVALNWAICKQTLVIPGAKNVRQAQENAGALDWQLTESEMAALDQLSSQVGKNGSKA